MVRAYFSGALRTILCVTRDMMECAAAAEGLVGEYQGETRIERRVVVEEDNNVEKNCDAKYICCAIVCAHMGGGE